MFVAEVFIVSKFENNQLNGQLLVLDWALIARFEEFMSSTHFPLLLFSRSVVSDSLWPHGLQQARPPCPSLSPRVCANSCPLSWWCHPTIILCRPLLLLPSIFPSIKVFPMNQLFASSGQSIRVLASASVLPMNIQGQFPLGLTGWISLLSKRFSRICSSTIPWGPSG